MLEKLGLRPLSTNELMAKLLAKYQHDLEYVKEMEPKFLEMKHTDPEYADAYLSMYYKHGALSPLYSASTGFINPVRCDMIGGDDRPVGITEKAIESALTYSQFKPTAKEIVRFLNTPSETWKEVVKEIEKQYQLEEPFEFHENKGRPGDAYIYDGCIVAEGEDRREKFLETLQKEWKKSVNSQTDMIYLYLRASGKIPGALHEFEELEYRKFMAERMGKAIENGGTLEKPIPIYMSLVLTTMEDIPIGFKFRGFGNRAKPLLNHLEEQALGAGMSVGRIDEKIAAEIFEERKFSLIDHPETLKI